VIDYNMLLVKELVMVGIQNFGWNLGVARVPLRSPFPAYLNYPFIQRLPYIRDMGARKDGKWVCHFKWRRLLLFFLGKMIFWLTS
jgi:hypothetical protein